MNKKFLAAICFFVLLSITSLLSAFNYLQKKSLSNVLGSYTFAVTKNNLYNLSRIKIIAPDERELNFYYRSGIWYFEEAADYFVNDKTLKNFYGMLQNSVLIEKSETQPDMATRVNIKTFSDDGKILDDIYLFGDDYSLMSYAGKTATYKITNTKELSVDPEDWVPSPLLEISTDLISAINFNGKYADRKTLDEAMQFSEYKKNFYETLEKIDYQGIMVNELFESEYSPTESKELKVYLHGGLNYRLLLFFDDENYYLQIVPERELIARAEVNNIIKIKKIYYEGWTFILTPQQGEILFKADELI